MHARVQQRAAHLCAQLDAVRLRSASLIWCLFVIASIVLGYGHACRALIGACGAISTPLCRRPAVEIIRQAFQALSLSYMCNEPAGT